MYFIKPKFWDKKSNTFLSTLLYPLSIIYYLANILKKKISLVEKFDGQYNKPSYDHGL